MSDISFNNAKRRFAEHLIEGLPVYVSLHTSDPLGNSQPSVGDPIRRPIQSLQDGAGPWLHTGDGPEWITHCMLWTEPEGGEVIEPIGVLEVETCQWFPGQSYFVRDVGV